jgi:hypothetical protein
MTVYLAGPISGHVELNLPAFESARCELQHMLHPSAEILIPHELYAPQGPALRCPALCWCEAMVICLGAVERSSMVWMVPGWKASTGARRERDWAREHGVSVGEWL